MFSRSAFTCLLVAVSFAQTAKRPLNHQDYDGWRTNSGQHLSAAGEFLPHAMFPREGDCEVAVRNLVNGTDAHFPAGARPQPAAASTEESPAPDRMMRGGSYLERDKRNCSRHRTTGTRA
jgi:hypothetical protein